MLRSASLTARGLHTHRSAPNVLGYLTHGETSILRAIPFCEKTSRPAVLTFRLANRRAFHVAPHGLADMAKPRKPSARKAVKKAIEKGPDLASGNLPEGAVSRQIFVKAEVITDQPPATSSDLSLLQGSVVEAPYDLMRKTEIAVKHEPGQASVAVVNAEEVPAKPKKKRSYANAYTRKGQGLAAAIDSMKSANAATVAGTLPEEKAAPKQKRGKKQPVKSEARAEEQIAQAPGFIAALEAAAELPPAKKPRNRARNVAVEEALLDEAAEAAEEEKPKKRARKIKAKQAVVAAEDGAVEAKPKKSRKPKAKKTDAEAAVATEGKEGEPSETKKRKSRMKVDPNAFKMPTLDLLEEAAKLTISARPVPNLGFACLNATLRAQKPPIYTNRDCIKKTWEKFGVEKISQLALDNSTAIAALIHWNHVNGIRFFRMSSKIFPWCTEWEFDQLPQKEEIIQQLQFAGKLARAFDQRLTFHPSHFVKLGCEDGPLLDRSIKELEVHSLIFDLMGYEPSHQNKINIHIGGQYGDKTATLNRFAKNFRRLNANTQKRLTVENDDVPTSYSITDLMPLHEQTGIPLVFDFHHHKFCPGDLSEEEAFKKAIATWPLGIRPVVHWSESQEGRKPHAHSDFVSGPLRLYGLEKEVDVMIESKAKELALMRLRDPTFKPSAAALAAAITTD